MMLREFEAKSAAQRRPGEAMERTFDAVLPDRNPGPSAKEGVPGIGALCIVLGLVLPGGKRNRCGSAVISVFGEMVRIADSPGSGPYGTKNRLPSMAWVADSGPQ